MNPYYEDDLVTLFHANSREESEWLSADVMITDPPYGTQFTKANPRGGYGRRQAAGHGAGGATIDHDTDTAARDAVLSLFGQKPVACFGTPRMPEPPGHWVDRLVWDKVEPGMNGGPVRYTHESIFLRGEGWHRINNSSYSILRFPKSDGMGNAERSQHPHRKPIGLMSALVQMAPEGAIADPFAGSGSTLLAARRNGRRVIGYETNEAYCAIAAARLSSEIFLGAM